MDLDKLINAKFLEEEYWTDKLIAHRKKKRLSKATTKKKMDLTQATKKRVVDPLRARKAQLAAVMRNSLSFVDEGSDPLKVKRAMLAAAKAKSGGKGPYGTASAGWGKPTKVAGPTAVKERAMRFEPPKSSSKHSISSKAQVASKDAKKALSTAGKYWSGSGPGGKGVKKAAKITKKYWSGSGPGGKGAKKAVTTAGSFWKRKLRKEEIDYMIESYIESLCYQYMKEAFEDAMTINEGFANWVKDGGEEPDQLDNIRSYAVAMTEERLTDYIDNFSTEVLKESAYQEFFKGMLAKRGIKSPMDLDNEQRKQFFDQIKKQWAAKKR